jgi:hypothetical protein
MGSAASTACEPSSKVAMTRGVVSFFMVVSLRFVFALQRKRLPAACAALWWRVFVLLNALFLMIIDKN